MVTVVGTLVQIVARPVIAAFSGGPDSPWWLVSALGAATLAVSLWVIDEHGVGLGLRGTPFAGTPMSAATSTTPVKATGPPVATWRRSAAGSAGSASWPAP